MGGGGDERSGWVPGGGGDERSGWVPGGGGDAQGVVGGGDEQGVGGVAMENVTNRLWILSVRICGTYLSGIAYDVNTNIFHKH